MISKRGTSFGDFLRGLFVEVEPPEAVRQGRQNRPSSLPLSPPGKKEKHENIKLVSPLAMHWGHEMVTPSIEMYNNRSKDMAYPRWMSEPSKQRGSSFSKSPSKIDMIQSHIPTIVYTAYF